MRTSFLPPFTGEVGRRDSSEPKGALRRNVLRPNKKETIHAETRWCAGPEYAYGA